MIEVFEARLCADAEGRLVGAIEGRTVRRDGKEVRGKILVPRRLFCRGVFDYAPCLVAYLGKEKMSSGKMRFDVRRIVTDESATLSVRAAKLRALGERSLPSAVKIETLDAFSPSTTFACWDVEFVKVSGKRLPVVAYRTEITDSQTAPATGRLYLPPRLCRVLRKDRSYVVEYGGEKTTKGGKAFYDVRVNPVPDAPED